MATLKAQIPAIQAVQEREVEIQKERYMENKERAKRIEAQLFPESVEKFTPADKAKIQALRQRAAELIKQGGL